MCRINRYFVVGLFCLVFLQPGLSLAIGDLALSSLVQQGKHHEVIEALAPEVASGGEVPGFHLLMLAGSYYETGKYPQALTTADLLDKRVQAGDSSIFGGDLSVYPAIIRAAVALDQGLPAEAIRLGAIAEAQLKPDQIFYRSQRIMLSSTLGVAYALNGNLDEARKHLEAIRAVSLFMANLGPEKFTAMARIQIALQDYSSALASISDPEADVSTLLTMFYDPTFQNVPRFFMRGKSFLETGKLAEAKQDFDLLLKHPQISQYGTLYWLVLYDRARIAIAEGDLPQAMELLQRAIEVIEERRSSISTDAGRIGFVGDKQAVYGQLTRLLIQQGSVTPAFEVVERAKSRALVDLLAAKTDFSVRGVDPEQVRRTVAEIDALDRAAQEKKASVAAAGETSGLRSLAVARKQLADTSPQLASLVSVSTTRVGDVAALLAPDEALVEYFYSGGDLTAFVLRNGELQAVALSGEGVDKDIQALRSAIEQVGSGAWQPLAEALYLRLWQPLQQWLAGSRRVLIVPHGALHYLPYSALRAPDGKQLIERYGLSFLPSASVLRYLAPQAAGSNAPMLVLGNPDLEDAKLDLKFAAEEALAVSKLYPGGRLLLRGEATETNFRAVAPSFRRIHIASHGAFQAEAPLQSGLYLAKDADNDGVLTVGELYGISLNAELVTLSACETGLGKVANGDDVVGLSRGFLYAGTRAIVASLWSVDDNATGLMMQSFYRNLGKSDKVEALRQAQLTIRRKFPHPFFWAAFQLTGRAD